MLDSDWWQSERSDDERRSLPTQLHQAYLAAQARVDALGPDARPQSCRVKEEGSDGYWAVQLWNEFVQTEGDGVPTYDGADILLEVPEVILAHPKVAAELGNPAVVNAMTDGFIVAPFDYDFAEALTPALKEIMTDEDEPRKTRLAAIMVKQWLERDFQNDGEFGAEAFVMLRQGGYLIGLGEETATNIRDRYPDALANINRWIDAAPPEAVPLAKKRNIRSLDDVNNIWIDLWEGLVKSEEERRDEINPHVKVPFTSKMAQSNGVIGFNKQHEGGVETPYGLEVRSHIVDISTAVSSDSTATRADRLLGAVQLVKGREYMSTSEDA